MTDNFVVVIPSYEPDNKLCVYVRDLKNNGINNIIVVNDGSSKNYSAYFDEAKNIGAIVLHYTKNMGKGYALKTAFRYIQDSMSNISAVVTADSDGQHTVKDVLKVLDGLDKHNNSLILGARDFNLSHVPFKSRFGNKTTSLVYKIFYGQYLLDTQTGLRAFNINYIKDMLSVQGNRFEYEMNMLIYFSMNKYPINSVLIDTIYENNNDGTHFHPIKDSVRIYKVLLSNIFKFASSSLISTLIDISLFAIFTKLFNAVVPDITTKIFISGFLARALSSLFNYAINSKFVFTMNNLNLNKKIAFFKYVLLVIIIITCSNGFTSLFRYILNTSEIIIKPIVDLALFIISYKAQKNWVFYSMIDKKNDN